MIQIKNKVKKYKGLIECSNDYFFLESDGNDTTKNPIKQTTTPATTPSNTSTTGEAAPDVAKGQILTQNPVNNNLATADQGVADSSKAGAGTPEATTPTSGQEAGVSTVNTTSSTSAEAARTPNTASQPVAGAGDKFGSDQATAPLTANVDTGNTGNNTTNLNTAATSKPKVTTPVANPTGSAGGLNSVSGMSQVGSAMNGGTSKLTPDNTSAGGASLSQVANKPEPQVASTILLSKLLPTESEIKTMPKAYLKMFREMIHNCGLTEDMLPPVNPNIMDKKLPGYTIDRSIMSNYKQLATDVLSDPLKAINATKIVPKFVFLDGVAKAIETIVSLAKAAKDFKKILNKPLNSVFDTLPEVINTGVKSMQNMLDENMDWIGTVMSKPLNQWNIAFADTTVKNWKCSELFVLCAICCSIVFTCSKVMSVLDNKDLAKNTVENNIKKIKTIKSALKESKAVFGGIRNLIEAGLDANTKLDKYADGKIPTNIILINSMILKAGKPAKDLLTRIVSDKGDDTTVDKSISINKPFYTLCTFASAFVLLWIKIAGMYIKNANDINIVSNMMSDKIRSKIDPSEKNVLKSLFGGVKEKIN